MSESVKVQCPGCQKTLKIPTRVRGKVVNCPGCKTAFKVAAPTAAAPPTTPTSSSPSPAKAPNPLPFEIDLPATAQPPVDAQLTTDNFSAQTMPDPFLDPLAPLTPNAPNSLPPAAGSWQGTPQYQNKKKPSRREKLAKSNRNKPSADDSENSLSRVGYIFVVIAVLTAFLPIIGLQVKGISMAGEYAPLIGMFFGLVGTVLIAVGAEAGSRMMSLGIAAVLAVVVIGVGFVGFTMERERLRGGGGGFVDANGIPKSKFTKKEREQMVKDRLEEIKNPPAFNSPTSQPIRSQPSIPGGSTFDPFADSKQDNQPAPGGSLADRHREALDRAARIMGERNNSSPSNGSAGSPFNEGRNPFANNPPNIPDNSTPPENPFQGNDGNNSNAANNPFSGAPTGRPGNSPFGSNSGNSFGSNSPFGGNSARSGPGSESDMRTRSNEGVDAIRLRISGNADLERNYRFVTIAGNDNSFGKVFFQPAPMTGIEFAQFDRSSFLLPADGSKPTHPNRIDVPEGHALVGLNFNFQNGYVKGVQCVFAKPDEKRERRCDLDTATTSDWIGEEVADEFAVKTMTKGRPVVGLAVFNDMTAITGVQLITTKK